MPCADDHPGTRVPAHRLDKARCLLPGPRSDGLETARPWQSGSKVTVSSWRGALDLVAGAQPVHGHADQVAGEGTDRTADRPFGAHLARAVALAMLTSERTARH